MTYLVTYLIAGLASVILAINIWRNTLGKDADELKVTKEAAIIAVALFLSGYLGLIVTIIAKAAVTYDLFYQYSKLKDEDTTKKTYFRLKFKK
jgi:uncharacterized membrane protein